MTRPELVDALLPHCTIRGNRGAAGVGRAVDGREHDLEHDLVRIDDDETADE